ncbi:ABC transporter substrate-binding protein [Desulfospira joergensenii]|uniref:ABC transporter substrate-binding protein n=1 Tax=Desulfospira joergensenii TaxID=53329 RepID=UPI0003B4FDA7|nr:ABC transporter substrate-binding protein [Desulfospira joergensenii]
MKRFKLLPLILAICFIMVQGVIASDTIPIGVPIPMTGWAAGSGADYFNGIKMSVDEINESGGLLGKQIEIIRFDSKGFEPEIVMQAANYLCGQKKVASIHAGWAGWGQDVRAYGKYEAPFFADDGSEAAVQVFREDPEKYSNIYQLTPTAPDQAESVFRMLTNLPYEWPNKKIVVINTDDSWGLEVSDTLIKNFEKIGWKVAKRETVPYGTTEWGVVLSQIRRIKPALIHFEIASGQENISFFQQFLKRPTNSIVSLGWGITPREVINVLGEKADGLIGEMPSGLPGPKAPNAAGQAWLEKWHQLYNYQVPAGAWITYTAVKAWANAVTQVGDAYDFKGVNKYLKENGYEGIQGKITWDKDNVLRLQKGSPEVHYQVQNGELQAIYTDPPLTPYPGAKFIKPRWIK